VTSIEPFPPSVSQGGQEYRRKEKDGAVPVREPATILLLGSGLIELAGYARKKPFKK